MKNRYLLFTILCLSGICGYAQTYSLEECCRMAVENNRTLISARLDLDKSKKMKKEAFTAYFPEISATGAVFQGAHHLIQEMSLIKKGTIAAVNAMQPVFAGGKIVNKNKLAKVQQEMSELNYELTEQSIVQQCTELYWLIVSLQANMKTLEAAERHLNEMMTQARHYAEAGVRLASDTLRISLKKTELLRTRMSTENAIKLNLMTLADLTGADWEEFEIGNHSVSSLSVHAPTQLPEEQSVFNNPRYKLSQKNVDASRYQMRLERGKYLPTLGIGVAGMYNKILDKGETNLLAFASLSVPISGWWGGSHAIKRARLNHQQTKVALEDATSHLKLEFQQTWNNVLEAYQQIAVAQEALQMAEENLRIHKNNYDSGIINVTDMLEAENLFIQNSNNMTTAYATYQIRLTTYHIKWK